MKIISYTNINRNLNRVAATTVNTAATSTATGGRSPSKACTLFKPLHPTNTDLKVHFKPVMNAIELDSTAGAVASAVATAAAQASVKEEVPVKETVTAELSAKDIRAYEHERQKAKRAEERTLKKAKKASRGFGFGTSKKGEERSTSSSSTSTKEKLFAYEDVTEEDVTPPRKSTGLSGIFTVPPTEVRPVEISLSELVFAQARARSHNGNKLSSLPRSASKSHNSPTSTKTILGLGLGEEGFEWVPSVRAVIAFDEVEFRMGNGVVPKNTSKVRDMEVDEPWEYVSVVSDGDVETFSSATSNAGDRDLSYADVVQLGKGVPASNSK